MITAAAAAAVVNVVVVNVVVVNVVVVNVTVLICIMMVQFFFFEFWKKLGSNLNTKVKSINQFNTFEESIINIQLDFRSLSFLCNNGILL